MTRSKKIVFSLILLGMLFALAEGACRLFLIEYRPEPVIPDSIGRFDSELGWALVPNAFGTSSRTGYEIAYQINSKGLRDDETDYQKPDGVFRIALVGDSRTFGYGVPIQKHFATLLEGYFKDVEVINLGISGFGVDQELLFLKSEGFQYQPDLVISYVAHYKAHRHMHPARWNKPKPYFVLEDDKLVLKQSPVPGKEPSRGMGWKVQRWVQRSSKLYRTFQYAWERIQARLPGGGGLREDEVDDLNSKDPEFMAALHELGEAIVWETAQEVERFGADYVVVTPMHRLRDFLQGKSVSVLDISKSMGHKGFDLPERMSHINESGNGVLAWELVRYLEAENLVPEKHWIAPGEVVQ